MQSFCFRLQYRTPQYLKRHAKRHAKRHIFNRTPNFVTALPLSVEQIFLSAEVVVSRSCSNTSQKTFFTDFFWLLSKIDVLKNFAKFHRKIPVLETLCKPSRLQRRYFPMKFENVQVYRFLQNTFGGCFCTLNFMCKSSLCRVKIFYQRYEIINNI